MIHDFSFDVAFNDAIILEIDEDMEVKTRMDRESFENALDDIADDLSEWIGKVMTGWLDSYYDSHDQMTEEQLMMVKHFIDEARP